MVKINKIASALATRFTVILYQTITESLMLCKRIQRCVRWLLKKIIRFLDKAYDRDWYGHL